jgi:hypothetical protein
LVERLANNAVRVSNSWYENETIEQVMSLRDGWVTVIDTTALKIRVYKPGGARFDSVQIFVWVDR